MLLNKLFYSKVEAAEVLGISKHTINRDIQLGRIQARKYGKRVLVPADELLRVAQSLPRAHEARA